MTPGEPAEHRHEFHHHNGREVEDDAVQQQQHQWLQQQQQHEPVQQQQPDDMQKGGGRGGRLRGSNIPSEDPAIRQQILKYRERERQKQQQQEPQRAQQQRAGKHRATQPRKEKAASRQGKDEVVSGVAPGNEDPFDSKALRRISSSNNCSSMKRRATCSSRKQWQRQQPRSESGGDGDGSHLDTAELGIVRCLFKSSSDSAVMRSGGSYSTTKDARGKQEQRYQQGAALTRTLTGFGVSWQPAAKIMGTQHEETRSKHR
ncbi:hypothetical protein PTSG_10274 [Salpingoeca rosetta]|uniref:Uncharacterized protein n=1 Tax=Salpingoeca rosetta (strain ATCC 50818 / BSB-021) TaxID=946362 RepID=F2UQU2_SALR5|nr:uncharacterized protein PTSG_10274 [Salpingoeca rosetta]EGD79997.1 hypothetical protein PTSG_10274 [Salpingoeca rosetta]|eukprot:XP_004988618.1 hypothetical protein PTSG_10274 [Salpingoeca rosetta]